MVMRFRQVARLVSALLVLALLVACPQKRAVLGDPDPKTLSLSAQVGESVGSAVTFHNDGDAPLSYSASASAGWLTVTSGATSTVAPGGSASVGLSAECPATPDELTATLAISSNGGNKAVTVGLSCTGQADIGDLAPDPLELAAFVDEAASGSLGFGNAGNVALSYSASASEPWLTITSGASGTVPPGGSATIGLSAECSSAPETRSATVTIASNDPDEPSKSAAVELSCTMPVAGDFAITLRFNGADFTPARQQVFEEAAARWAELITGDQADVTIDKPDNLCGAGDPPLAATIDDLYIDAFIVPIDGEGGVLGSAGPCLIRSPGNNLPLYGVMRFDSADIAALEAEGTMGHVILHEMGHVLGIGSLWDFLGHLDYATDPAGQDCNQATLFSTLPTFDGSTAAAEFAALGGSGQPPVEDEFGPGTQCSHWDEAFFNTELMTGFLGPGNVNPLSRLTGASLTDIGYQVSLAAADGYSIPACSPNCLKAIEAARRLEDVILLPRFATAPDGTLTRLEPRSSE